MTMEKAGRGVRYPERGSSRILAFVSTILFAALAFVVTSPEEKNKRAQELGKNQSELASSQIMQFAIMTETGIMRMLATMGVSIDQVSFENPYAEGYENPSCYEGKCKLFHPQGGGVAYREPDERWLDQFHAFQNGFGEWVFPANTCVWGIPSQGTIPCNQDGSPSEELIVMLPYLRKELCQEINRAIHIPMHEGEPPKNLGCGYEYSEKFTGILHDGYMIRDTGGKLERMKTGCFHQSEDVCPSAPDQYVFFHVLRGR